MSLDHFKNFQITSFLAEVFKRDFKKDCEEILYS